MLSNEVVAYGKSVAVPSCGKVHWIESTCNVDTHIFCPYTRLFVLISHINVGVKVWIFWRMMHSEIYLSLGSWAALNTSYHFFKKCSFIVLPTATGDHLLTQNVSRFAPLMQYAKRQDWRRVQRNMTVQISSSQIEKTENVEMYSILVSKGSYA